jgi:hypothetical protein
LIDFEDIMQKDKQEIMSDQRVFHWKLSGRGVKATADLRLVPGLKMFAATPTISKILSWRRASLITWKN